MGAIHLQQYIGADYRAIPTVGTLFLLTAIVSASVGIGPRAPIKQAPAAHKADAAITLLALAGLAIAIGSLVALFISESGSIFGFAESGYRLPVVVAIVAEAATIALLGPVPTPRASNFGPKRTNSIIVVVAAESRGSAWTWPGRGASTACAGSSLAVCHLRRRRA